MIVMRDVEVEVLATSIKDSLLFEVGCKGFLCSNPEMPEGIFVKFYPDQEGVDYNPTDTWLVGYPEDEGIKFKIQPVA